MLNKYIVLDIENPNTRGNSICAIAIIVVEDNTIKDKIYTLINPEDRFDSINSQITGIDSSKVLNAPTLKEYWLEIKKLLENSIVVGHNVIYDLSVLVRSLHRYDINVDNFKYCCTLELARKNLSMDSYKLENIVNNLDYQYNPHIAIEDAMAATYLFEYLKNNYVVNEDDIHNYMAEYDTNDKLDERLISNLHSLKGIIQGVTADGVVDELEIERLKKWIDENLIYRQYTLFDKIISQLTVVLEDNIIDSYEQIKLNCLVSEFTSSRLYSETTLGIQMLQGIIDGIGCNNKIKLSEIKNLEKWLLEHNYLSGVYPYDKIYKIIQDVLSDGVLSEEEKNFLQDVFNNIICPVKAKRIEVKAIEISGKTFCLTGEFMSDSKAEIAQKLMELGGIEKNGVSSKVDYLFVGGMGSDAWKFGKIGGKIAKALELQEKGCAIQIVAESDMKEMLL